MAIVSIKWASLLDPNKQPSLQDATGAAPVVPTPTFTSATASSYTVAITGYDAQFTYTVSASVGSAVRTGGNVTVSGLSGNQSSTLIVTAANTARELSFSASQAFLSLPATPTLSQTGQTTSSVTVTIGNYDAGLTYTIGSSAGSATRSGNIITVTGLSEGQTVTVTATASNASGNSAQGSVSATSQILGDFESIATVVVGAGGSSSIVFSSIPQTYKHLQIRARSRTNRNALGDVINIRINGDSGSNYAYNYLENANGSLTSGHGVSQTSIFVAVVTSATSDASQFGNSISTILDYTSTAKNKSVISIGGCEQRTANLRETWLSSGTRLNTAAVTSITIIPNIGTAFAENSTFSLYGVL